MQLRHMPTTAEYVVALVAIVGAVFSSWFRAASNDDIQILFNGQTTDPSQQAQLKINIIISAIRHMLGAFGAGLVCWMVVYASTYEPFYSAAAGILGAIPGWPILDMLNTLVIDTVKTRFSGVNGDDEKKL